MIRDAKRTIKWISFAIFFTFIIVYAFFRSYDLIFGVKINNVNLTDGAAYKESTLNITGNAKNAIKITLNGREISVDQDGNFNETIVLLSGYNIINITAEDKFGHRDEKNFRLVGEWAEEVQ